MVAKWFITVLGWWGMQRDPAEFVQLLMANQRHLYAYIRAHVRTRDDADELLQQTSVVLWEKFDSFRPDGDFVRWACGVARLEVLNHLRHQRRWLLLGTETTKAIRSSLVDASADIDIRLELLAKCMRKLPKCEREILRRHYRKNESVKEIAAALSISESSVYKSLSRSRDLLYECIQRRLLESKVL